METTTRFAAIGRRKESVARLRLLSGGSGVITVNGVDIDAYFPRETDRLVIRQPLRLTNTLAKYDIRVTITGGGISGQAGALRQALSRALVMAEPETKDMLRKNGFLTRDSRAKERKKSGQKGARKQFQWTKR